MGCVVAWVSAGVLIVKAAQFRERNSVHYFQSRVTSSKDYIWRVNWRESRREGLQTAFPGRRWLSYLLPAQLVVHLDPLHLLQALLQPLVALPQLADVVARFGQDAAFTLEAQEGNGSFFLFFLFVKIP